MDQEARIAELEAQVARLATMLDTHTPLARTADHGPGDTTIVEPADAGAAELREPQTSSRRGMLKLAGAVAAGAVASTVAARPAAATTDEAIVTGHVNSATQQTVIQYGGAINGVGAGAPRGNNLTGNTSLLRLDTSASPSDTTGGLEISADGTGIVSSGATGMFAVGSTDYGVIAFGGQYAFAASVTSKANLWLQPNNSFFGESLKTPPLQRTDDHIVGEIDCVDGDLWMCVAAGTPGSWRKITGPAAAGSLHLLAVPKRVYDSRPTGAPESIGPKTPLAAHSTRTIDCRKNGSGVPAAARGVLLNAGVVSVASLGFLAVTPGGAGPTGTSTVNWNGPGIAIANGVTVGCGAGATIDVSTGPGATDFFIDVFGYYI